ncbi:MAG: hypothetical protein JO057_03000, partial [Chloroflexi bacterium]|nr:hypothetical protein [Chloroflexota bacterium]
MLPTLSRRDALRLLGSSATLALLAACGQATPQASPTLATSAVSNAPTTSTGAAAPTPVSATTAGAQAPTPQPKSGGTLRTAVGGLTFGGLDAHNNRNFAIYPVFDTLIEYDHAHQPQPVLAESWEFSTDSTQLKLNLQHGVQFHTGRELTSDDVKFNILRVRDPSVAAFTNFMSR